MQNTLRARDRVANCAVTSTEGKAAGRPTERQAGLADICGFYYEKYLNPLTIMSSFCKSFAMCTLKHDKVNIILYDINPFYHKEYKDSGQQSFVSCRVQVCNLRISYT